MEEKILVVSEDRVFHQQIDRLLGNEYQVKFNLHACNAFKFFVENHSDLVIVDSRISADFKELLEKFMLCQWEHSIILLADDLSEAAAFSHAKVFPHSALWSTDFGEYLSQCLAYRKITDSSHHKEVVIERELLSKTHRVASVLLAKSTDNSAASFDVSIFRELQSFASSYPEILHFNIVDRDIFAIIEEESRQHGELFKQLSSYVFQHLSPQYAIFTIENIIYSSSAKELVDEKLSQIPSLGYFCEGEILNLTDSNWSPSCDIPFDSIHAHIALIVKSIMGGKYAHLKEALTKLFSEVKGRKNTFVREYMNFMMHLVLSKLTALCGQQTAYSNFRFNSCETEFQLLEDECFRISDAILTSGINDILRQSVSFIFSNLSTDISLSDVAANLQVSKNYIGKCFSTALQTTFLKYYQKIKLEQACFLLKASNMKVFAIAQLLGYSDRRYFSRVFKNQFQITPEEYRITHLEEHNNESALEKQIWKSRLQELEGDYAV